MDRALREQATVSNIPFTAISNALTPMQRQSNDALAARRLQAQKNLHHAEDIEELDDTAVDSIHDQPSKNPQEGAEEKPDPNAPEENIDIQSLQSPPAKLPPKSDGLSHLDISA